MNNTLIPTASDSLLASALLEIKSNPATRKGDSSVSHTMSSGRMPPVTIAPSPLVASNRSAALLANSLGLSNLGFTGRRHSFFPLGPSAGSVSSISFSAPAGALPYMMIPSSGPSAGARIAGDVQGPGTSERVVDPSRSFSEDESAKQIIRRNEVDAALHSKPQRGRKRENLSELERLELTRTRNREHAKSTRIRKKARYDELLLAEKQLKEIRDRDELTLQRRRAVIGFVQIQQEMIHGSEDPTDSVARSSLKLLSSFVDVMGFHLRVSCGPGSGKKFSLDQLSHFWKTIVRRITSRLGSAVVPKLTLGIQGGETSVAVDANHGAFAPVELSLSTFVSWYLIGGILAFDFAPDSSKIRSIVWACADDGLEDESLERLAAQFSHPSVVSLDLGTDRVSASEKGDEDDGAGPGMII